MKGVLNQPTQRENPTLTKIAKDAEAQVPENLKEQFLSIMVAGGKLMWSPDLAEERRAFDQALQQSGDVPTVVAHTVIKICSIIQNESQSEKPLDAMGLAATVFMTHVLQYVEAKHKIQVTNQLIDETAQLVGVNLLKMYGVTEQHMQELIKQRAAGGAGSEAPAQPEDDGTDASAETDEEEA